MRSLKALTLECVDIAPSIQDGNNPLDVAKVIQKLNLPKVESITFTRCRGLSENEAFSIVDAAPNLPNLKEYGIFGANSALIISRVRRFYASSLAANLENFTLYVSDPTGIQFKALIENGSNMKNLKSLTLYPTGAVALRVILMVALSGAQRGFPMLKKLTLHFSKDDRDKGYWPQYCKTVFDPIWPGLEISLPSHNM